MTLTPAWMLGPSSPSPTTVGAADIPAPGIVVKLDDLKAYIAVLDPVVSSLWSDVKAQLYWLDLDKLPPFATETEMGENLRARRKRKGTAQAQRELAYATDLHTFKKRWEETRDSTKKLELTRAIPAVVPVGPALVIGPYYNDVRSRHEELLPLYRRFLSLGGKPSEASEPPSLPSVAVKPLFGVPRWIWWVAGVGVVAYLVSPYVLALLAARKRAPGPAFAASSDPGHIYVGPRRIHAGRIPAIYSIDGACCYVGEEQALMALGLEPDDSDNPSVRQVTSLGHGASANVDLGASGTFNVRRMT